ncbi:MAG: glycosyltransferase [Flavobacteriaceae bacterium]
MVQLLRLFLSNGCQITFASTSQPTEYSAHLNELDIRTQSIVLNDSSFDAFIKAEGFDMVMFDRFLTEEQFGWRVATTLPGALRILDTEDLHSLRHYREGCLKKGMDGTVEGWKQQDLTKREMASILRSDLSLIISRVEMDLLQKSVKIDGTLLYYLPFIQTLPSREAISSWPPFEKRTDFICIGNGKHGPNVDALQWLKAEIWPLVRKQLPQVQLHIYGAYLPQMVHEWHREQEGFLVHGWAPNIHTVLQGARVNLAPLRFGAGLKSKLFDAMANGTPTVTTSIGVEGLPPQLPIPAAVADTAAEMAHFAVQLYNNPSDWQKAQTNGMEILRTAFDAESHIQAFTKRLTTLQQHLMTHRDQNFMGQLLQHQTAAATRFMGKWIEEKNERKKDGN